jgi:hypothetical protein
MKQRQRRDFIKRSAGIAAGLTLATSCGVELFAAEKAPLYKISLAQWSLNKLFKAKGGDMDNLDFAKTSRGEFEIDTLNTPAKCFRTRRLTRSTSRK